MKLYKRLSLLLSMGIMGIGLLTFNFSPAPEQINAADVTVQAPVDPTPTPTTAPTPTPTVAPTPTPVPNNLTEVSSGEIYNLVVNYLNAKLTCDVNSFTDLVTDVSYINETELVKRTELILGYDDIICYTKRGVGSIDYIVYYTYNMRIATLESTATSIEEVYVTKDESGKYRIFMGYLEPETQNALRAIAEDEDVVELTNSIYEKMIAEIDDDEDLFAFWIRLYEEAEDEEFVLPEEEETSETVITE